MLLRCVWAVCRQNITDVSYDLWRSGLQADYPRIDLDSVSVRETQEISFHRQSAQSTQTLHSSSSLFGRRLKVWLKWIQLCSFLLILGVFHGFLPAWTWHTKNINVACWKIKRAWGAVFSHNVLWRAAQCLLQLYKSPRRKMSVLIVIGCSLVPMRAAPGAPAAPWLQHSDWASSNTPSRRHRATWNMFSSMPRSETQRYSSFPSITDISIFSRNKSVDAFVQENAVETEC